MEDILIGSSIPDECKIVCDQQPAHFDLDLIVRKDFNVGDIVQHFKRETVEDKSLYVYRILAIATHSETKEKLVIYQALYSNSDMGVHYNIVARPYDMFMSEVDHVKYPNIKQKYRFELLK